MQILYYSSHFKSLKHMCNFKSIGTSFQGSTLLVFNEATCAVWQPAPTVRENLPQVEVKLQPATEHHTFTLFSRQ